MYLALFLIVIAVFCVIAGIFSGGIFTIILVPIAAVAIIAAVVTGISARAAGLEGTLMRQPDMQPKGRMPEGAGPAPGEEPVTPDEYVEARQKYQ